MIELQEMFGDKNVALALKERCKAQEPIKISRKAFSIIGSEDTEVIWSDSTRANVRTVFTNQYLKELFLKGKH